MCPLGLAVHLPSYETLLKYATEGFPVRTGRNWTNEEIHVALMRVTYESSLAEEAIAHFAAEERGKGASKQARLVCYEKLKLIFQHK